MKSISVFNDKSIVKNNNDIIDCDDGIGGETRDVSVVDTE